MKFNSKNSFKSLDNISSSGKNYKIFNLKKAEKNGLDGISKLPKSLKVLLENLLRYEDDISSSYLSKFSNKTLRDFGSFEIPSKPFFSAFFKLKIL